MLVTMWRDTKGCVPIGGLASAWWLDNPSLIKNCPMYIVASVRSSKDPMSTTSNKVAQNTTFVLRKKSLVTPNEATQNCQYECSAILCGSSYSDSLG